MKTSLFLSIVCLLFAFAPAVEKDVWADIDKYGILQECPQRPPVAKDDWAEIDKQGHIVEPVGKKLPAWQEWASKVGRTSVREPNSKGGAVSGIAILSVP